jgi:Zn-dependent M28 family amino/carboxypeptidase
MLPGTDPALAGEYVCSWRISTASACAKGRRRPHPQRRDGQCDGRLDLLEVARQMGRPGNRPRRPVIFAAVTAEEKGLLGAQYLARNPVTANGRIVGVVNLDMPVLTYDFTDVIAFGAEHSTLGPIVRRAASRMGVALADDPLPEQGLFTRSDHYMFVREGIPSVFLMTGFAGEGEQRFRGFLAGEYHSPRDDMSLPFNWRAGARFAELNYLIAREIADAPQAPLWYRDSFFGSAFAPRAAKAPRPAAGAPGGVLRFRRTEVSRAGSSSRGRDR